MLLFGAGAPWGLGPAGWMNLGAAQAPALRGGGAALRPPATPLVACDPYFSVWSFADRLTDDVPRHWTGKTHGLASLIRIDGQAYRLMGTAPAETPAFQQTGLRVWPTRTVYEFEGAGVHLTLTFTTPALPDDIDILSRPVTFLTWEIGSIDGAAHAVQLYYDHTSELVVNEPAQKAVWGRELIGDLAVLRLGSADQPVLARNGDDLRIDWGYLYAAAPASQVSGHAVTPAASRTEFARAGRLEFEMDTRMPRAVQDGAPVAAFAFDLGMVGSEPVRRWLVLAYDDLYSIQYFGHNLRPYWRRNGWEAADLLRATCGDYGALIERCAAFDREVMEDLERVGGWRYAQIAALAYRQCLAATKIAADAHGQPLAFPKENFSNGCIGTVDIIYPMAPQFLLFSPSLVKALLVPVLEYAASDRWKFPFAPHDLGRYPHANGQVYGGGERTEENQMPVEETGNLLLLVAALAHCEGDADFAREYWPLLAQWGGYLKAKGFDPENQLCTDDFAGHLAHNVNLSAKAICGLAALADLAGRRGDKQLAEAFGSAARDFAARWVRESDDGDHYRLAFDRLGTWSLKYNLVWDRLLGLNLFPAEVARREMAFYRKTQQRYGLPLDSRQLYTKLDWIVWTATLTGSRDDFEALVDPVYRFLDETPDRIPMTDWYWTNTGRQRGFRARSVVGGVFLPMLYDGELWRKWAGRDRTRSSGWAPLPRPPRIVPVAPTAEKQAVTWRYTFEQPPLRWKESGFDDGGWASGPAGFGAEGTPGSVVRTAWNSGEIWLRREFRLSRQPEGEIRMRIHHDEDVEVYLNGVAALSATGYTVDYQQRAVASAALDALRPGRNVMAIHCRQTSGGQYIDAGLVELAPPAP